MASESSGSSFNTSQSSSTPQNMDSAQSDWGLMQSQLLHALADKTYQWSMQQYAKGEQVSDQTIANFMEMSGKGKGLADTLLHQYQDQIKPLFDKYLRDAGSYASEGRQSFEAGKAMSTVAQADKAAMKSAMEKIAAYGGEVNRGKTQEMIIAGALTDAAARVGAGNKAIQDTEATGRAMQEKALAMGQQMPGQAINAIQSSYAGLTGAENAILGLLNTGKNLADAAAPYHQAAAAANKLPPVANKQQSTSQGGSQQQSKSTDPPQKDGKGGGEKQPGQGKGEGEGKGKGDKDGKGSGAGEGGGQKFGPPQNIQAREIKIPQTSKKDDEDDPGTGAPDEYSGPVPYMNPDGSIASPFSPDTFETGKQFGSDTPQWDGPQVNDWTLPPQYGADGSQGFNVDPGAAGADNPQLGGIYNPNAGFPSSDQGRQGDFGTEPDDWMGGSARPRSTDMLGNNFQTSSDDEFYQRNDSPSWQDQLQDTSYRDNPFVGNDDVNDTSYPDDYYADDYTDDTSYPDNPFVGDDSYPEEYDNYDASSTDDSSEDFTDYENPSGPSWDDNYDEDFTDYENPSGVEDDYSDYDSTDYGGGDYGGYDEYAGGGQVRPRPQRPMAQRGVMPTTGGAVPRSASPSQGRQTDDISARLNAGEYVIPRDVVKHQGTKFFTDLIAKSRKLRTGMTGAKPGPTMRPSLPQGRPTFRSRPLPPR